MSIHTRALGKRLRTLMLYLVVANGDPAFERICARLQNLLPGSFAFRHFAEDLSELGKAGSDFVLMPSRYEPCGLPQMECPRFGTLPVVRATGGLRDTVTELEPEKSRGNGFVFEPYTSAALLSAMDRAIAYHQGPVEKRAQTIRRVMHESLSRFTLAETAERYAATYSAIINGGQEHERNGEEQGL